ncbi:crocetin glucosyltransferase 3-like isoform X2 [Corylus avellana]|uniref:crocetin glucosyltransferase 3-like isoform X2 n=1 Tax=Corylus avellana TaxID=13451 RepID=UPI00286CE83B|nr:crocetin glucosyltransferase 3-like isoform X2 [Corylus avellana]
MGSRGQHILLLPFLAHGHLIPFLALARQLQQTKGFTITIVSTPLNIQYLKSTISSDSPNIHLAELPFCSTDHGLPPNAENTENLSPHNVPTLCHASVTLEAPFRRLVHDIMDQEDGGRPPLCIISDVFFGWAVNVAKSVGSVSITFTTCGAYGTAAYMSFWLHLPHLHRDYKEFFKLPWFPDSHRFHCSQLNPLAKVANGTDAWSMFMRLQISLSLGSHGWLCNTVEEIEPLGMEVLRKYLKLPVRAIGPLLPPAALKKPYSSSSFGSNIFKQRAGKKLGISQEKCIEWLNLQGPSSVLYISFGSQNTISASQMMELALGLEGSGKPFIWVLRPPTGFDIKGEFKEEWLPKGFEKRMTESKQGLLVHNWAPQLEILSHESTGAFLSHCGWNSALESLSQGVPIIGLPMGAEQIYNSMMLMEEMGVCEELARGVQSDIVGKEVIMRVIELVMDKKKGKGKEMQKKASIIGGQIRAATKDPGGEDEGSSLVLEALNDFCA